MQIHYNCCCVLFCFLMGPDSMKAGNTKMGMVVPLRADGAATAVGCTRGKHALKISPWVGE